MTRWRESAGGAGAVAGGWWLVAGGLASDLCNLKSAGNRAGWIPVPSASMRLGLILSLIGRGARRA